MLLVLLILFQVVNGLTDDSHRTIFPTYPETVSVPAAVPEHTELPPVRVPLLLLTVMDVRLVLLIVVLYVPQAPEVFIGNTA